MSIVADVLTIFLGFAISGAVASLYEGATGRQATFGLLREPDLSAVAAIPLVTLGGSYILARNFLHGARTHTNTVASALVITLAAGLWSLLIGATALHAIG